MLSPFRARAPGAPGRVLTKKVVIAAEEELRRNPRAHGPCPQYRRFADYRGWCAVCRTYSSRIRLSRCFNAHSNYSSLETMRNLLLRFLATNPCVNVRAN